jgi:hypothetical protein
VRELGGGLSVVQAIFTVMLACAIAALAIGVAVVALTAWTAWQVVLLIGTRVPAATGASGSVPAETLPRPAGVLPSVAAALAAITGGLFMTSAPSAMTVVAAIAAALVSAAALITRSQKPDLTRVAVLTSGALALVVLFVAGVAAAGDAPVTIAAEEAVAYGSAATIEDVWATVECLDGTAATTLPPEPEFTSDSAAIDRAGTCVVDTGDDVSPVYFFQASDAAALDLWLTSGDLHGLGDEADDADLFRDGAVGFVTADSGSILNLLNDGYDSLDLR